MEQVLNMYTLDQVAEVITFFAWVAKEANDCEDEEKLFELDQRMEEFSEENDLFKDLMNNEAFVDAFESIYEDYEG